MRSKKTKKTKKTKGNKNPAQKRHTKRHTTRRRQFKGRGAMASALRRSSVPDDDFPELTAEEAAAFVTDAADRRAAAPAVQPVIVRLLAENEVLVNHLQEEINDMETQLILDEMEPRLSTRALSRLEKELRLSRRLLRDAESMIYTLQLRQADADIDTALFEPELPSGCNAPAAGGRKINLHLSRRRRIK
jgi:hypothetical protein